MIASNLLVACSRQCQGAWCLGNFGQGLVCVPRTVLSSCVPTIGPVEIFSYNDGQFGHFSQFPGLHIFAMRQSRHAYVPDSQKPGQLKVLLGQMPVPGDYWVAGLGPPTYGPDGLYQWSIVTGP